MDYQKLHDIEREQDNLLDHIKRNIRILGNLQTSNPGTIRDLENHIRNQQTRAQNLGHDWNQEWSKR